MEAFAQGALCCYQQAEAAYVQLAVAAAIAAGGVDGDDDEAPTLTLVDDCFFVTHHSVQRAVRSGDAKLAVVPLLHEIVDALRNLVYPKIMGTLRARRRGGGGQPRVDRRVQCDRSRRRLRVAAPRPGRRRRRRV